jgi:hypothetical protein
VLRCLNAGGAHALLALAADGVRNHRLVAGKAHLVNLMKSLGFLNPLSLIAKAALVRRDFLLGDGAELYWRAKTH